MRIIASKHWLISLKLAISFASKILRFLVFLLQLISLNRSKETLRILYLLFFYGEVVYSVWHGLSSKILKNYFFIKKS